MSADFLTTAEVARALGIHLLTLYQLLHRGEVPYPPRRVGTCYLWTPADLEAARAARARRRRTGRPRKEVAPCAQ